MLTDASRLATIIACALLVGCSEVPSRPGDRTPRQEVLRSRNRKKTRLAVVGDYGTGTEDEHRVARAIERWTRHRRVGAFLTTGDNVYPSGHPSEFEQAWHRPYGWVDDVGMRKVASLGNHDVMTDRGRPVMDLLEMPHRWYVKHFRAVDVFVLDSTRPHRRNQRRWLRWALKSSNRAWQVVLFHHPPFNCGEHGPDAGTRRSFVGILSRHGADLVLTGHEHSYQRFASRKGVTYVVTGGGGARLYDLSGCTEDGPRRVAADDRQHHFVKLAATPDRLSVRAVTPGGTILDRHSLRN